MEPAPIVAATRPAMPFHAIPIRQLARWLCAVGLTGTVVAQAPSFQREIRPLLAEHCFPCHGPDAGKRKAGLRLDRREDATQRLESGVQAIDPEQPAASAILARIVHADPRERMPPPSLGKPLSTSQLDQLRRWILAGAEYEPHWSLVPPRKHTPPAGAAHPIDAFVQAELRRRGLVPSPAADRATWLRRITLDLTGLPPSTDEIDAFLADASQQAEDRVLTRLFASPRYGEHMARYWLDAARYSDTHGYHLDNLRTIWPYRDWVVQAFQRNLPYDQFTIEQLAGDLLPEPTRDQLVATGFHRCLPTTAEGGLIAEEYLAKYAMDRVDTTATVWLGTTLGCAQCHDHKYDPISQRDYYRMLAFWKNVEGDASDRNIPLPPPSIQVPSADQEARSAELAAAITTVEQAMSITAPEQEAAIAAWARRTAEVLGRLWQTATPRSALSRGGATTELLPDGSVRFTGENPAKDVHELVLHTPLAQIHALRIEAIPDPAAGNRVGRAHNGNIVLGRLELEVAPATDPTARHRIPLRAASADYNQQRYPAGDVLDDSERSGWGLLGGQQQRRFLVAAAAEPFGSTGGTLLHLKLGYQSGHPSHTIGRIRIAVSASADVTPVTLSPWQQIGPFRGADFATVFRTEFGPEQDPAATQVHGELTWSERTGLRDNTIHTFRAENAAFYFARTITSPNHRELTLRLGSDDGIKLWHDGALRLDREVARAVAPDQDEVTLTLHPGENRLLVKLVNGGGDCGFFFRVHGEQTQAVPAAVLTAVTAAAPADDERALLRRHWREQFDPQWRELEARRQQLAQQRLDLQASIPGTLVLRAPETAPPTHVLRRGRYDQPGEQVEPGVPEVLPPLVTDGTPTRLDFARWLLQPDHPLTARVYVNRLWQQMFGIGLVATPEDFGVQGAYPSHPELLDWLAVEFVESGWDVQRMLRLIATSATYRQSSASTPAAAAEDPDNRWLARGPRHRLDGEVIRDSLLSISGLLVERIGGPGVKPYQPPGLWEAVGYADSNTRFFQQDHGEALWRRSLYTFWKRTAPPPMLLLFDAPMRESCAVRRPRTNTPLQALALLNDVQAAEAARAFAARLLARDEPDAARLHHGFRLVTGRLPEPPELEELTTLLAEQRLHYAQHRSDAAELVRVGESTVEPARDPAEWAAWSVVASVLLNLDEAITKR